MPDIPEGVKLPQDHKQADAAQAEALDPLAPVKFTHNGVEFKIDQAFRDDVELLEELEQDHYIAVCKQILGDHQWRVWKATARGENGRISTAAAQDFLSTLFEELGAGN